MVYTENVCQIRNKNTFLVYSIKSIQFSNVFLCVDYLSFYFRNMHDNGFLMKILPHVFVIHYMNYMT